MREAVECVSERWCDAVKSMSVQIHVFVSSRIQCLRYAEKGMYQCECECECEVNVKVKVNVNVNVVFMCE